MTEYDDAYNWEKTWLNSSPIRRSDGRQTPEPHFQHKRHFPTEWNDSYDVWGPEYQSKGIAQDPFFIIHGRNHGELAYPNILYRRAKSAPRETRNPFSQSEENKESQRPNSDGAMKEQKSVKHHSRKHHHSKSRSHSKEKKKPTQRWPELKVDIPNDSPKSEPPKQRDDKRSYSSPNANADKRVRPQSSVKQVKETKSKSPERASESNKSKFKSEEHISRRSEFESKSAEPQSEPRSRFQSEYQANYRDLSNFTNIAKVHNNEAVENRIQAEGCHFSRKHFNQLDSASVNLWDPPRSLPEIVGITKKEFSRRLKEYKVPTPRLPPDRTFTDGGLRFSNRPFYRSFNYTTPSNSTRNEPKKCINKATVDKEEPRVMVLPSEKENTLDCSPTLHRCNPCGNFLISRVRPNVLSIPSDRSLHRFDYHSPISPSSLSSSLSLVEQTFDRALRRRNKLLISACRN